MSVCSSVSNVSNLACGIQNCQNCQIMGYIYCEQFLWRHFLDWVNSLAIIQIFWWFCTSPTTVWWYLVKTTSSGFLTSHNLAVGMQQTSTSIECGQDDQWVCGDVNECFDWMCTQLNRNNTVNYVVKLKFNLYLFATRSACVRVLVMEWVGVKQDTSHRSAAGYDSQRTLHWAEKTSPELH